MIETAPKEVPQPPVEIERKFLITSRPGKLEQFPHKDIAQGYIAITDEGTEVRVRSKGEKYSQTVKSGSGKTRTEVEFEISKDQFDALWPLTKGKRVEKTRYEIPYEDVTLELDIYHGNLQGLATVEVEFTTEKQSNNFVPPGWLSEEVTYDPDFKNQSLAVYGIPSDVGLIK